MMSPAILATKLYIPPSRPNRVIRSRLLKKMNLGQQTGGKLVLISAPAGFGKTTLACEWAAGLPVEAGKPGAAWLSLDAADNDLAIFMSYLVAAFQTCRPGAGELTRQLLEHSPLPAVDTLLLPLINNLAAPGPAASQAPLVLVLDDYHTIHLAEIHQAVTFLIEHLPPGYQIVLTTRQDPLLPLSRWRARGWVVEIRLKDLRFTEEEAADFLRQTMGLTLQSSEIAALEAHTEGWIAGLQLASISMLANQSENEESTAGFVQAFTGNDRFVMDYLIDEVLSRQPEAIQRFLLHTSFLERFNADLSAELLGLPAEEASAGQADGDEAAYHSTRDILNYLDRANLFLIPLDQTREWYRYHHLFAELLQYRFKMMRGSEALAALKRTASRWFDEHGFADEAIRHAQSAADWGLTSQLVLKHAPGLLQQSEMAVLLRWMKPIPDEVIRASNGLCQTYGYLLSITGDLSQGREYLTLAEEGYSAHENLGGAPVKQGGAPVKQGGAPVKQGGAPVELGGAPVELGAGMEGLGATLAFASYNSCFRGDFNLEIEQARRALSLISQQNHWLRGLAAVSLGMGLCHTHDPAGCEAAMQEAFATAQKSGSRRTYVHSLTHMGRIRVLGLDFQRAEQYFRQATTFPTDGPRFFGIDIPLFDLAMLKIEQNDLQQAMALVEQGFEANLRSGNVEMRAYGYRLAARLYQLRGEKSTTLEYLQKVLSLAASSTLSPLTLSLNAACQIEMAITDHDYPSAEMLVPQVNSLFGLYTFCFYPELAVVHLRVRQGRKAEALQLLQPALPKVNQPGWEYPRLQVLVLQSVCQADPGAGKQLLREALSMAEPAGAMRCFLDLGPAMLGLLQELRPQLKPAQSAFADRLLAAFESEKSTAGSGSAVAHPLVEPLSERELEVLRLLADGLSNLEIAQRLFLSPNTLKAHTQNIYSKMDVHSRVQVVNKARELGLID